MRFQYKKSFLLVSFFMIFIVMVVFFQPLGIVNAAESPPEFIYLGVPIFGIEKVTDAVEYINIFYKNFLRVISYLAMLMVLFGGLRWITAAGNTGAISGAKNTIIGALVGLTLAYTSVLILRFVNISLVELKTIRVPPITPRSGMFGPICPPDVLAKEPDPIKVQTCGETIIYNDGKSQCVSPGNCGANDPKTTACLPISSGGGWGCEAFQRYCEELTEVNDCDATDLIISNLYPQISKDYVCAKDQRNNEVDKCKWVEILQCGGAKFQEGDVPGFTGDPARVSCLAGTKGSECEGPYEGQYENCDDGGLTQTFCTDKPRAGKKADCICCLDDGLDCRSKIDGCNEDEIPILNERCDQCFGKDDLCCAHLKEKFTTTGRT